VDFLTGLLMAVSVVIPPFLALFESRDYAVMAEPSWYSRWHAVRKYAVQQVFLRRDSDSAIGRWPFCA